MRNVADSLVDEPHGSMEYNSFREFDVASGKVAK